MIDGIDGGTETLQFVIGEISRRAAPALADTRGGARRWIPRSVLKIERIRLVSI